MLFLSSYRRRQDEVNDFVLHEFKISKAIVMMALTLSTVIVLVIITG